MANLRAAMSAQASSSDVVAGTPGSTTTIETGLFSWADGTCHRLPEDYKMTKGKVKDAMRIWFTADTVGRRGVDNMVIPPLRAVERSDFADQSSKRRYSQDLKPLMGTIEKLLACNNATASSLPTLWSQQKYHALTQPQFDKLWSDTLPFLPKNTAKGFRRAKPGDVSMSYARKVLREELGKRKRKPTRKRKSKRKQAASKRRRRK